MTNRKTSEPMNANTAAAMDTVDSIERMRFLGREFLTWLWFESEAFEGRVELPEAPALEIYFEQQITLSEGRETSRLKGDAPSAGTEAREALRQGKLPTSARLKIELGGAPYVFVVAADKLALGAVRLPPIHREAGDGDDPFDDRLARIEELDELMLALFGAFLALRSSPSWASHVLPSVQAWVRGEHDGAEALVPGYVEARRRALVAANAKHRTAKSTPPPAMPSAPSTRATRATRVA